MSKNLTWCVIKKIFRSANVVRVNSVLREFNRFKYTVGGYGGPTLNPINVDYREVKSYKQFLNESKTGPNAAASGLMTTLDVTKENAIEVVKNCKGFNNLSTITIIHNDDLLRDAGTNKSTLRQNMYALAETTPNLRKKIKALQYIDLEINTAISLFQLSVTKLLAFAHTTECDRNILTDHNNRLLYLADRLNADINELCVVIPNSSYMLHISITKLIEVTEYLIDVGMSKQYIVKDFMIYRYSMSKIKERVLLAKRAGITTLKPWIVRCSRSVLDKSEARFLSRQDILKTSNSVIEFISQELNCDIASVEALIKRDPTIISININTLSLLIKMFRDYGYTINNIYRAPRALHTSYNTIKKRYDALIKLSPHKPELFALSSSRAVFNRYLSARINEIC